MFTIIFYTLIFTAGALTSYIDWDWFFNEAISFKNVENPVSRQAAALKPNAIFSKKLSLYLEDASWLM